VRACLLHNRRRHLAGAEQRVGLRQQSRGRIAAAALDACSRAKVQRQYSSSV
jgi:hypothetical protein